MVKFLTMSRVTLLTHALLFLKLESISWPTTWMVSSDTTATELKVNHSNLAQSLLTTTDSTPDPWKQVNLKTCSSPIPSPKDGQTVSLESPWTGAEELSNAITLESCLGNFLMEQWFLQLTLLTSLSSALMIYLLKDGMSGQMNYRTLKWVLLTSSKTLKLETLLVFLQTCIRKFLSPNNNKFSTGSQRKTLPSVLLSEPFQLKIISSGTTILLDTLLISCCSLKSLSQWAWLDSWLVAPWRIISSLIPSKT